MQKTPLIATLALVTTLVACAQQPTAEERRYEVKGRVVSVDADAGKVTLDHEDIGDFMPAMTMAFPLKDEWAFDQMEPGDRLNAVLVVRDSDFWLEQVVISQPPELVDADSVPPARLGEPVPNVELVNQDGETIHISDYRDKALFVTFIYTRCPLSDFCPRMTAQFRALEMALKEDAALYDKTHLLTISFDPAHDTPDKLRQYALDEAHITPETFAHWEFATGTPENIGEIADFLNLEYSGEDMSIVHNLRTGIVAPDGTLFELQVGNSWEPDDLLESLHTMTLGD